MSATVDLGESYYVSWRDGQKHPGQVIERRFIKKYRDNPKKDESDYTLKDYEYYVHFHGFDRRLDEWVSYDRLDLVTSCNSRSHDKDDHGNVRKHKRKMDDSDLKSEKESMLVTLEKDHEEITRVKNIQCVVLGKYEIETWYFSPYPDEYCGGDKLYLCEYCLKYAKKQKTFLRHQQDCRMTTPPGKRIYLDENLSMYEVDGKENKIYCQNLCLLSKLFLDHKTLYYDVDPFLFYILCEVDADGSHIVGYFSKEKQSQENYNLACILTFPPYQRKGYGKFLISLSYELTKREGTTGSPEKPLSDLGKISYRSYWAFVILKLFQNYEPNISVHEIGRRTGIKTEDILSTLHSLNLIRTFKGQHIIYLSENIVSKLDQSKKMRLCNPKCLTWEPPISKN